MNLSIFDLDETLMLPSAPGPYSFDGTEVPNPPVLRLLQQRLTEPNRNVVVVTGRREQLRDETLRWLQRHVDGYRSIQRMYFCGDNVWGWRAGKLAAVCGVVQQERYTEIESYDDDVDLLLDYRYVLDAMLGAVLNISESLRLHHVRGPLITLL